MRLTQIRHFLCVVDAGSLHAAAKALSISQPAITKSLGGLESELQVQLLQRTPRGIALTPQGRLFLARARAVDAEIRRAREELAADAGEATVTVGVGPQAATFIVPPALAMFRKRFPFAGVRIIEVVGASLPNLLRDKAFDLAVGGKPTGRLARGLAFKPLYHNSVTVAARRNHPLAHATSLAELKDAEWVSLGFGDASLGHVENAYAKVGLPPPQRIIASDSYNVVNSILVASDAVAILPSRLVHESIARDALQALPIREPLPAFTAGLLTRADGPLSRVVQAMADALVAAGRQPLKKKL